MHFNKKQQIEELETVAYEEYSASYQQYQENSRNPIDLQIQTGLTCGPFRLKTIIEPTGRQKKLRYLLEPIQEFLDLGKLKVDCNLEIFNENEENLGHQLTTEPIKIFTEGTLENADFDNNFIILSVKGTLKADFSLPVFIREPHTDYSKQIRNNLIRCADWLLHLNYTSAQLGNKFVVLGNITNEFETTKKEFNLNTQTLDILQTNLNQRNPLVSTLGPPGSGKTNLLAAFANLRCIKNELEKNEELVLITARSHAALNEALLRINKQKTEVYKKDFLVCKKCQDDNFIPELDIAGIEQMSQEIPQNIRVWGCTLNALSYFQSSAQHKELLKRTTLMIVDEAGQIPFYELVGIGFLANNAQVRLFGDNRQLLPILLGNHPRDSLGKQSCMDVIEKHPNAKASFALETSHRLNSQICNFIQTQFYPDIPLKPGHNENSYILDTRTNEQLNSFLLIPTADNQSSKYCIEEINTCDELITYFLAHTQISIDKKPLRNVELTDIAILTPHNWQVNKLKLKFKKFKNKIKIGTVDKMQGQDVGIIIYSNTQTNINSIGDQASWLFEKNRLNVAFSRAKAQIVLLVNKFSIETAITTDYENQEALATMVHIIEKTATFNNFKPAKPINNRKDPI
jgi:superfamily I DNA and/or RNA helicase